MDPWLALVGAAGIEPATLGLEIRCSILLSYAPVLNLLDLSRLTWLRHLVCAAFARCSPLKLFEPLLTAQLVLASPLHIGET
jgi:hypothetical protein